MRRSRRMVSRRWIGGGVGSRGPQDSTAPNLRGPGPFPLHGPVGEPKAGVQVLHVRLRELAKARVTGEPRPAQARTVYEILGRDYGYGGSYRAVVRHLGRRYRMPPVRTRRRVETPPGVQVQLDWFVAQTRVGGEETEL